MSKEIKVFFILGNHNLAFEECIAPKWTVLIQSINSPVRILKIFRKI